MVKKIKINKRLIKLWADSIYQSYRKYMISELKRDRNFRLPSFSRKNNDTMLS
jgi:hypothetical protein